MIERIGRISFERPGLTFVLVLAAAGLGAMRLADLRRDVFPDLSVPVFSVIVQNAAMAPEEMEAAVAIPLEGALGGLPRLRRVRSSSEPGVATVRVEFEPDADYMLARQLVTERVGQVAERFPPGTDAPLISSLSNRLNEIFELTLEAEPGAADLMTLRDIAEFDVRYRLLAVPGVAAVESLGGYLRQFQVQVDPERMASRGVTLEEVMHAAEGANENAAGGFVVRGPTEWNVRALGRVQSIDDLRQTVVTVRGTTPVMLGDVADVREAPALRRGIAHRLRGEVVSCRVVKQFEADTVTVAAGLRAALAEIERALPPGVRIRVVYDQSSLIDDALAGVGRAILIGAVLVVVVLFALLGRLGAALLVTLNLPLSVLLAGLALPSFGVGLNAMTLGGLAIAVGLLVDASIIMTENIQHRGAEGVPAREAAREVARPIAFATLIVVAVFLPLMALGGIEGRMYRPLAAAVVSAMIAALLLALTVVPIAAARLLGGARADQDVRLIAAVKRAYRPLLDFCMRHAAAVRVLSLGLTVPALWLAFRIGSELMPEIDEGALLIQTMLPAEASLREVDRLNHRAEDLLREFPEVEDVVRRTGRSEHTEDPMPHTLSDVLVVLRKDRSVSARDLEAPMREALEAVPGLQALFTSPLGMRIDEGLGGTPADIAVRFFGSDLEQLTEVAERAETILGSIRGVEDLRTERVSALPQLRIDVDRAAAARAGLRPSDVVGATRILLAGQVVSDVWVGQRRFDLMVRLGDEHRGAPSSIRGLPLVARDGTRIPLGQVARVEEALGPAAIRREGSSRRVAVEASVSGRDLKSTADEVRARLGAELEMPPGTFFDVGGRAELQERAARSMSIAVIAAVIAVAVLLQLALGSFAETLIVLATLPDAFVGGILALWLAGETWNVSSLVGLIGLFGIAVQNGLVLITQTRALLAEGVPFDDALRQASVGRVRPKLVTACTAILGLLPLLLFRFHGTEIERPLAVVMIGGLISSTLFTLLALPTFYSLVHRLRERSWTGGTERGH